MKGARAASRDCFSPFTRQSVDMRDGAEEAEEGEENGPPSIRENVFLRENVYR